MSAQEERPLASAVRKHDYADNYEQVFFTCKFFLPNIVTFYSVIHHTFYNMWLKPNYLSK